MAQVWSSCGLIMVQLWLSCPVYGCANLTPPTMQSNTLYFNILLTGASLLRQVYCSFSGYRAPGNWAVKCFRLDADLYRLAPGFAVYMGLMAAMSTCSFCPNLLSTMPRSFILPLPALNTHHCFIRNTFCSSIRVTHPYPPIPPRMPRHIQIDCLRYKIFPHKFQPKSEFTSSFSVLFCTHGSVLYVLCLLCSVLYCCSALNLFCAAPVPGLFCSVALVLVLFHHHHPYLQSTPGSYHPSSSC